MVAPRGCGFGAVYALVLDQMAGAAGVRRERVVDGGVSAEGSMSYSGRWAVHLAQCGRKAEVGDVAVTMVVLHFTEA